MEASKVDQLADLGAGDATLSLKILEPGPQDVCTEILSNEPIAGDPEELLASPLIATDSGFADQPTVGPIFVHLCGQCSSLPTFQYDCLKVCTWLRASDVQYQIFNHTLNLDGRFPTIETHDAEIQNSGQILADLTRHFNRSLDADLTIEQEILAFSLGSLIEHTLVQEHWEWSRTKRGELLRAYDIDLKKSLKKSLPTAILEYMFKKSSKKPKRPTQNTAAGSTAILGTLSRLLGAKKYFFGNDTVSSLDVVAFAILAPILAISEDVQYVARDAMKQNYVNLVDLVARMKERFYPDWEDLCSGSGGANCEVMEPAKQRMTDVDLTRRMQDLSPEIEGHVLGIRRPTLESEV